MQNNRVANESGTHTKTANTQLFNYKSRIHAYSCTYSLSRATAQVCFSHDIPTQVGACVYACVRAYSCMCVLFCTLRFFFCFICKQSSVRFALRSFFFLTQFYLLFQFSIFNFYLHICFYFCFIFQLHSCTTMRGVQSSKG